MTDEEFIEYAEKKNQDSENKIKAINARVDEAHARFKKAV